MLASECLTVILGSYSSMSSNILVVISQSDLNSRYHFKFEQNTRHLIFNSLMKSQNLKYLYLILWLTYCEVVWVIHNPKMEVYTLPLQNRKQFNLNT